MSEPASPVDRLLDLALYAPVGLAIAAIEGLPHWVELGRRQVESRMGTARAVGRIAVDQGSRQGGEMLRRVAAQADAVMAALGLVPDESGSGDSPPTGTSNGSDASNGTGTTTDRATTATAEGAAGAPTTSPSAGSAPTDLDAAHLAIPGYDTLSASQVVQRLPGLSPDELEAVRLYELAGRARKTVLLKAAQLQQGQ